MSLSDQQFLQQLQNTTLPPEMFNHYGHLRLAWLMLQQYPLEQAINHTCNTINAYATALGATDKFHYTLTAAIVRIMAQRKASHNQESLDEFLTEHPELENNLMGLVLQHYQPQTLNSPYARQHWQQPGIRSFSNSHVEE